MQADRILDDDRIACGIVDDAVEIMDVAAAIAAQLERIGQPSQVIAAPVPLAGPE